MLEALPFNDVIGFSGWGAEERLRLRGRPEKSMVSVSCGGTGVKVKGWVWLVVVGGDCAVETDAGRRLGLERTTGWAAADGEVFRGLVSSSRTEV
jgi:hypothetical protein